jgi:hypothetical protein
MMRIDVDEAIELIRTEYAQMPGLSMTSRQVRRVWSLSNEVCQEALNSLTRSGFLTENRDSSYVKATRVPVRRNADAACAASRSGLP